MLSALRVWVWVHKWSSLSCTLFILMACVTGLPLIFHDEIENALTNDLPYASLPPDAPRASLDLIAAKSLERSPGETILSVVIDDKQPRVVIFMAPSWSAVYANKDVVHWIKFDAHTAEILAVSSAPNPGHTAMNLILQIHKTLLAADAGVWLLAVFAVMFIVATVSGIVVYGPFMRRRNFGALRTNGSRRAKWLDLHNLLGALTAAWVLMVGFTGLINEVSDTLFDAWRATEVRQALKNWNGPPTVSADYAPLQSIVDQASRAAPGMTVENIITPVSIFSTPYHYMVWVKGNAPLTSRLFSPMLVNARSGEVETVLKMPWYLRVLEVSRPLHFGDYGGLPLKFIWAVFDLATIVILISGLYLWFAKRGKRSFAVRRLPATRVSGANRSLARTTANGEHIAG